MSAVTFSFIIVLVVTSYVAVPASCAQTSALETAIAKSPNPELVRSLTKELSITPEQATGGAGASFGLAKSKLCGDDFAKVSKVAPGIDSLLKAAPKPKSSSPLDSLTTSLPRSASGMVGVACSFRSLGLSPGMAERFIPVMTQYVDSKGGASVASLLGDVLK